MTQETLSVLDEMCRINNCNPWVLRKRIIHRKRQNIDFLQSIVKDIGPIYTSYHQTPMEIIPDDISIFGADTLVAFGPHRSHATVEQFYICKYGITLKYPHLPCVVMYGGNRKYSHRSYFPMELLYIKMGSDKKDESINCVEIEDKKKKNLECEAIEENFKNISLNEK